MPAGGKLSQGGATLALPGQQAHQAAVSPLTQWIQGYLALSVLVGRFKLPQLLISAGQVLEGINDLHPQTFSLDEDPFFKCLTVIKIKPG